MSAFTGTVVTWLAIDETNAPNYINHSSRSEPRRQIAAPRSRFEAFGQSWPRHLTQCSSPGPVIADGHPPGRERRAEDPNKRPEREVGYTRIYAAVDELPRRRWWRAWSACRGGQKTRVRDTALIRVSPFPRTMVSISTRPSPPSLIPAVPLPVLSTRSRTEPARRRAVIASRSAPPPEPGTGPSVETAPPYTAPSALGVTSGRQGESVPAGVTLNRNGTVGVRRESQRASALPTGTPSRGRGSTRTVGREVASG